MVGAVKDYAIFMLDREGRVSSWNSGAQQIKGYTAEEITGRHFSCFYSAEDIKSGKPEMALRVAAAQGRFEDEGWRVRKDGSKFWANVIITALRDDAGDLLGFAKVTRDFTERRRAQEALRRSERSLLDLSGWLLRVQDDERRRLGRELHDSVAQMLSRTNMNLSVLQSRAKALDSEALRALSEAKSLATRAMEETRTLSYLLCPPMLDHGGLAPAIHWYAEGFSQRSRVRVGLNMPANFPRLPDDVELTLFRIVQEGLTNVHRHSGSHTAEVQLGLSPKQITLEVRDHGKGIPSNRIEQAVELGVGIRGMRERVRQLGGHMGITSTKGKGTRVEVSLPRTIGREFTSSPAGRRPQHRASRSRRRANRPS
jgi:PAS domain S-box-containing protein